MRKKQAPSWWAIALMTMTTPSNNWLAASDLVWFISSACASVSLYKEKVSMRHRWRCTITTNTNTNTIVAWFIPHVHDHMVMIWLFLLGFLVVLLVAGCWFLVSGFWFLVSGCWLLLHSMLYYCCASAISTTTVYSHLHHDHRTRVIVLIIVCIGYEDIGVCSED